MVSTKIVPTGAYSIHLTLDRKSESEIENICKKIKKSYPIEFVFDGSKYNPHLTLYLFSAPVRNQKEIVLKVNKLSDNFKTSKLVLNHIEYSPDGWVLAKIIKPELLISYHMNLLGEINELRMGVLRSKYRNSSALFKSLSLKEQNALLKYGDRHSGALFYPHISLTKVYKDDIGISICKKYDPYVYNKEINIQKLKLVRNIICNGKSVVLLEKYLE